MKTLDEQLQAARRELAMRQRVYPGWVGKKRMTQEKADHEIECMKAIVETLEGRVLVGQQAQGYLQLRALMGYTGNGTYDSVTCFQDDATGTYHVKAGKVEEHGLSLLEALEKASAADERNR